MAYDGCTRRGRRRRRRTRRRRRRRKGNEIKIKKKYFHIHRTSLELCFEYIYRINIEYTNNN